VVRRVDGFHSWRFLNDAGLDISGNLGIKSMLN